MARKQRKEESAPIVIYDKSGKEVANYPPQMIDTIKQTVAKNATDEELYMYLNIAAMYGFNPFTKEIWFAKTKEGEPMIMTGVYGYQKLAKRDPDFVLCTAHEVRENDEFELEQDKGEIVGIKHKFKHTDRGKIVGAYAYLKTKSGNDLCSYVEFREYDRKNRIWRNNPSAMIKKVAKSEVYKSFCDTNGLTDYESMREDMSPPKEDITVPDITEDEVIEVKINDSE